MKAKFKLALKKERIVAKWGTPKNMKIYNSISIAIIPFSNVGQVSFAAHLKSQFFLTKERKKDFIVGRFN